MVAPFQLSGSMSHYKQHKVRHFLHSTQLSGKISVSVPLINFINQFIFHP